MNAISNNAGALRSVLETHGSVGIFKLEVIEEKELGGVNGQKFSLKNKQESLIAVGNGNNAQIECSDDFVQQMFTDLGGFIHFS